MVVDPIETGYSHDGHPLSSSILYAWLRPSRSARAGRTIGVPAKPVATLKEFL
jgi:hypothetical protein